jgi:hypothetical protein
MSGKTGGCLCGRVRYRLGGPLRGVVACHCTQCRRTSGHFVAATQLPAERAAIEEGGALKWFRSSAEAERGFCGECGSNLFWRRVGSPLISVMAGTLDGATGLRLERQIHTDSAGDYYDLPDVPAVPQSELD